MQLSVPVRDAAGKLNEVVGPVTLSAGASFEELGEALRSVAADARMAMDGHVLFRATETTKATGNICLLLGVLLRARIIRIKIEHSRFVDLEHVDALRPKETVVGHSEHDRARNERILGAHFENGFLLLTRIDRVDHRGRTEVFADPLHRLVHEWVNVAILGEKSQAERGGFSLRPQLDPGVVRGEDSR